MRPPHAASPQRAFLPGTHASQRPARTLRACAAAAATVSLAAGAHVVGGGTLPVLPILLAILALSSLAVSLATRVRLTFPAMAALLGAGQLALHEAFTAFGGSPDVGGMAGSGSIGGPAGASAFLPHHGVPPWPVISLGAGSGASDSSMLDAGTHLHSLGSAMSLAMLACHALATVATALLLTKGEDALWQLMAWLKPLVELPAVRTLGPLGPRGNHLEPQSAAFQPWRNLRQDSRRGPPAVVVFS
ncbi:hypothetical protein [Arthrobacter sp. M4]|uniref:hypothetical protein n=1 Tax=Arthrobacter sp. M4 TaxID=218160 RepID=UPI001CDBC967|nr:hypothetical protein [Arthrobacter sp. M4]MCA4134413.1 hypothetical protein [Arthrobacter sp. M4]